MHRKAGSRVFTGLHFAPGPDIAPHSVLRRIQGHKIHVFAEYIDGRAKLPVNSARVGQQAHPLALQALEAAVAQNFYARLDLTECGKAYGKRRRTKKVTKKVARQHSITSIKNPTYPSASCKYPATSPGSIIERAMNAVQMA